MVYINACSTISHQASFANKSWVNELTPLALDSEVIKPNYKEFIDPRTLRRMSNVLRMGLACSIDCMNQSGVNNPDAIIVGTGLGCLTDTEKFLKNTLTIEGLIPPTAFIQSTHNTIAGQISLATSNHNYNMTHTQNNLSFEHSVIDALLCLNEDSNSVLVGGVDESIAFMDQLLDGFGVSNLKGKLTNGASFFMLENKENDHSKAKLINCEAVGLNKAPLQEVVTLFLSQNKLSYDTIDMVIYNSFETVNQTSIEQSFKDIHCIDIEPFSGVYFTNNALAMHLGCEILANKNTKFSHGKEVKNILLLNTLANQNIGLTLIQSLEA